MFTSDFRRISAKSKIASSPLREQIDLMLLGETTKDDGSRYTGAEIVAWAAERGLQTSEAALSRYRNTYLMPSVQLALKTQDYFDAIAKATGRQLSLPTAVMDIISSKALELLHDLEFKDLDPEKALRLAVRAAEVTLKLRKGEKYLTPEVAQQIDERLTRAGLDERTLDTIRRELYGLSS